MHAYCLKCKEQVEVDNVTEAVSKNGRKMIKGTCSKCNTKVNKFVSGSKK